MKVPKSKVAPRPMTVPGTNQQVPPAYLAMAMAHMDSLGKLNLQATQPTQALNDNVQPTL